MTSGTGLEAGGGDSLVSAALGYGRQSSRIAVIKRSSQTEYTLRHHIVIA